MERMRFLFIRVNWEDHFIIMLSIRSATITTVTLLQRLQMVCVLLRRFPNELVPLVILRRLYTLK